MRQGSNSNSEAASPALEALKAHFQLLEFQKKPAEGFLESCLVARNVENLGKNLGKGSEDHSEGKGK